MGSVVPQYINCNSGELKQGVSYIRPEDYEDQIDGVSGNHKISTLRIYESDNEQVLSAIFHNKVSGVKWSVNIATSLLHQLLHQMVRDVGAHDCTYGFYTNERIPAGDVEVVSDFDFNRLV